LQKGPLMQALYIEATEFSPEIILDVRKNIFSIKGNSAPEDVRLLYYPVVEWIKTLINDIEGGFALINTFTPFILQVDLCYFNSSSAKFLHDIFFELKRFIEKGKPVRIEWFYDEGDEDMLEAGNDMSILAGYDFIYICKSRKK
jgi:hypothetical protein